MAGVAHRLVILGAVFIFSLLQTKLSPKKWRRETFNNDEKW